MGWLFSIVLLIAWCVNSTTAPIEMLVAAGLFAIAGAISFKDFGRR